MAAIEQEKARLNSSLDSVREELEKVDVSADLAENLESAQAALDRAKAQVRARACVCVRRFRGWPIVSSARTGHPCYSRLVVWSTHLECRPCGKQIFPCTCWSQHTERTSIGKSGRLFVGSPIDLDFHRSHGFGIR